MEARLQAEHYPRVKFRIFLGSYWEEGNNPKNPINIIFVT